MLKNMNTIKLKFIEKFLDKFVGKKCSHCGSRDTTHMWNLIRGYNKLFREAIGNPGLFCNVCLEVTWDIPREEFIKGLPRHGIAYDDSKDGSPRALQ